MWGDDDIAWPIHVDAAFSDDRARQRARVAASRSEKPVVSLTSERPPRTRCVRQTEAGNTGAPIREVTSTSPRASKTRSFPRIRRPRVSIASTRMGARLAAADAVDALGTAGTAASAAYYDAVASAAAAGIGGAEAASAGAVLIAAAAFGIGHVHIRHFGHVPTI